jgi:hypothetical protein
MPPRFDTAPQKPIKQLYTGANRCAVQNSLTEHSLKHRRSRVYLGFSKAMGKCACAEAVSPANRQRKTNL